MNLLKSSEDYLETILILKERTGNVRSIDIANELEFSKASVSVAMKKLRENNYILVDNDGFITLTEDGLKIASNVHSKHKLLTDFFIHIGVPQDIAAKDACNIEHDLSEITFEKLFLFTKELL